MSKTQRCIVVLGSGRSGTSLTMQLLGRMGVSCFSESTPTEQNPNGDFEDTKIIARHRALINALEARPHLPLPDGWESSLHAQEALYDLRKIVQERMTAANGVWAFKEPNTAVLLPLWIRLFNFEKIFPTYILAVRDPKSVILSMGNQYGKAEREAEFAWILRNAAAVRFTGGRFFTLHYEQLLKSPLDTMVRLAEFCKIAKPREKAKLAVAAIDDSLYRSRPDRGHSITLLNVTERMYSGLKLCGGPRLDDRARRIFFDIERQLQTYSFWVTTLTEHSARAQRTYMRELRALKSQEHNEMLSLSKQLSDLQHEHKREIEELNNKLMQHSSNLERRHEVEVKELSEQHARRQSEAEQIIADLRAQLEMLTEQHRIQVIELQRATRETDTLRAKLASRASASQRSQAAAARKERDLEKAVKDGNGTRLNADRSQKPQGDRKVSGASLVSKLIGHLVKRPG